MINYCPKQKVFVCTKTMRYLLDGCWMAWCGDVEGLEEI